MVNDVTNTEASDRGNDTAHITCGASEERPCLALSQKPRKLMYHRDSVNCIARSHAEHLRPGPLRPTAVGGASKDALTFPIPVWAAPVPPAENKARMSLPNMSLAARRRLPEVPRLRNKFRDQRRILGDHYLSQASTVRRFHLEVARRLGLVEEDWLPLSIYEVCVDELEHCAERKLDQSREAAALKLQHRWRARRDYKHGLRVRFRRRVALLKLQRWWHVKCRYQMPLKNRIASKPIWNRAALKIQAMTIGNIARQRMKTQKDLMHVRRSMDNLKRELCGDEVAQCVRVQAMVRGYLGRKRARLRRQTLAALQLEEKEIETSARPQLNVPPMRRLSFMHKAGTTSFHDSRRKTFSMSRGRQITRRSSEMLQVRLPIVLTGLMKESAKVEDENSPAPLAIPTLSLLDGSTKDKAKATLLMRNALKISDRAATSTPLAKRLRRPLGSGSARMGGLQRRNHPGFRNSLTPGVSASRESIITSSGGSGGNSCGSPTLVLDLSHGTRDSSGGTPTPRRSRGNGSSLRCAASAGAAPSGAVRPSSRSGRNSASPKTVAPLKGHGGWRRDPSHYHSAREQVKHDSSCSVAEEEMQDFWRPHSALATAPTTASTIGGSALGDLHTAPNTASNCAGFGLGELQKHEESSSDTDSDFDAS